MRGREPCVDVRLDFCGITPAYAGKSESYGLPALPRWDHPRVCGEEAYCFVVCRCSVGSPPRMRGRGPPPHDQLGRAGITPAYAGKSRTQAACVSMTRDHPRVCGEEVHKVARLRVIQGSPPRMRGRVLCHRVRAGRIGITPAYAGKRPAAWAGAWRTGDHPRVCGEEDTAGSLDAVRVGSPPRMRGRGVFHFFPPLYFGITPAYAGKSHHLPAHTGEVRDHPRVCGEERSPSCVSQSCRGSPPRMRGRAVLKDIKKAAAGITPAYAGKSFSRQASR